MTAAESGVHEAAPAKINLTLHVRGRRADGFHLLDSLVTFADAGDGVTVRPAARTRLRVTGPMAAGVPTGGENSVLRAAALIGVDAAITLDKHLPAAAGIGGGSSDAAATLRALARLGDRPLPEALCLGADVPVCVLARAARMRGIGEDVMPVRGLPVLDAVLINPRVPVSTREVFARLAQRDNPPMPGALPRWCDTATLPADRRGAGEAARGCGMCAGADVGIGGDLFRDLPGQRDGPPCGGANRGRAARLVGGGDAAQVRRATT
jgi:4-diphosphocytidyl-2-C-methyl-D-erythritol kinase